MADILGSEDYKGICSQKLDEIIYSKILTPAIIDVSQTTLITQDPRRVLRKLENFESDDVNTTKKICSISDNNKHVAHKKATVFRCFAKTRIQKSRNKSCAYLLWQSQAAAESSSVTVNKSRVDLNWLTSNYCRGTMKKLYLLPRTWSLTNISSLDDQWLHLLLVSKTCACKMVHLGRGKYRLQL